MTPQIMQIKLLVSTLKTVLREKKIRYSDIAKQLEISVSSVKRLFKDGSLTLSRLEKICELAQMSFFELVQLAETSELKVSRLSKEQELQLCKKPMLLLVCICVGAGLSFDEITKRYSITTAKLTQHFIHLHELGIIELLPDNLYRLRISKKFSWIPNGPLHNFFIKSLAAKYIGRSLYGPDNHLYLKWGIITPASAKKILLKIEHLIEEYVELESDENRVPEELRATTSLLVFYRENWISEDFDFLWR